MTRRGVPVISLAELCNALGLIASEIKDFIPGAGYYPEMDWLIYLTEDVQYRSDQLIPGVVDVLWHPYENRIVGLKIWGVSQSAGGQRILKIAGLLGDT